jgi:hypothetical protein
MPTSLEHQDAEQPPDWAVDQSTDELYDETDPAAITERAWELTEDAEQRRAERHDEYDDPDQGGEG